MNVAANAAAILNFFAGSADRDIALEGLLMQRNKLRGDTQLGIRFITDTKRGGKHSFVSIFRFEIGIYLQSKDQAFC